MTDAYKNFAYGTVLTAPSPATSGTSLVLQSGQGALMPAVPFNAVVWPAGQQPVASTAEIVRVTARTLDTLTIARAQEGTSARAIVAGDQFSAAFTSKLVTDLQAEITADVAAALPITYRKATAKDVTNTVSELDLLNGEITIGAGVMGTTKLMRVVLTGDWLHNASADLDISIKLGGTTLSKVRQRTAAGGAISATRFPWKIEFTIAELNATNSNELAGKAAAPSTAATTGFQGSIFSQSDFAAAISAIDFSTAKLLEVTALFSVASASLSFRLNHAVVEIV